MTATAPQAPLRFSQLEGMRVGVWGVGREIRSFAAQLARRLPAARIVLAVLDEPPPDLAAARAALRSPQAEIVGAQRASELMGCEVVVRSPGVSIHRPELRELLARGARVTTATSLWLCEHGPRGVLAVTGTKGKSTTAALAAHLARAAGVRARLAGNIGAPALDLLEGEPAQLVVLELSSYQIADLRCGAEVALFTNLYADHLDWHGSRETYRAEKLRLLELPGLATAVLNGREELLAHLPVHGARLLYGVPSGWDEREGAIVRAGVPVLARDDLPLQGAHNALNLCAALAGLQAAGVEAPALPRALEGFRALPHRLEQVACAEGVRWVDDSISTTPESTLAALRSFAGEELVLIGGGQERGQDYAELGREIAARGAAVVGIPTTGARLVRAAREAGVPPARALLAADLQEAAAAARTVALAQRAPSRRAVVLLSPAAPSFDRFRDFEERGELFARLVRRP